MNKIKNRKIALVHDGIFCRAGGERVLLTMHRAFPGTPIYTSMYDPSASFPEFRNCDIRVSSFNLIAKNEKQFKSRFFPFAIIAMKKIDLTDYDVVIMTTTHCAKYVKCSKSATIFAYCFTPFRLAWHPMSYNLYSSARGFKRSILKLIVNILRKIDYKHSQKITQFIAMTEETSLRIKNAYNFKNPIPIIKPSIDIQKFTFSENSESYYLVVSRLEKYKKVDLVISAFNKLDLPLVIVGRGIEKNRLKQLANKNITFFEGLSDKELLEKYRNCKAFIFPQHEDYGLTPLEANACGKPVIAFSKGGILETQIPFSYKNEFSWTSVFFEEQDVNSLFKAIKLFETLKPNPKFIRKHAEKFDDSIFINNIQNYVFDQMKK